MFTGIIEEIGIVKEVQQARGASRYTIAAKEVLDELSIDDSIAVNGVCLTVVHRSSTDFQVEAVEETLRKTTLSKLKKENKLNLERSLRLSDRLGGHLVQGHVDGVGKIKAVQVQEGGRLLSVVIPAKLMKYVISEGSIAIDGVSLTVARKVENSVTISLIPHTLEKTTFADLKTGQEVNVEVDLIGKYIENLITNSHQSGISVNWMQKMGFE